MKWLALLLFPITAFAVNLDGSFTGRWDRVHAEHNHFLYVAHSFLLFNDCGMAKMLEYRYLGENRYDTLKLTKQEHELVLEVKNDYGPRCMSQGKHSCTAFVMHWDNVRQHVLSLILSCDKNVFFRAYEQEMSTP